VHLGLYDEPVHTDGRGFDTYGPFARLVLALARHFDQVTVFAPTTDQPTYFSGAPLDAPNICIAPLPFFMTHAGAMVRAPAVCRVFRRHAGRLDAVLVRSTAPLAYLLWLMTRRRGVPFMYLFAEDPFEMIARSPKYRGPYRWFARAAYGVEFAIQKHIMRRAYSFTAGRALYEKMRSITPRIEPAMKSTLNEEDYYPRQDSCTGSPVRILYVGYLRHGKGLEDLLEALRLLRDRGRAVELDLVGDGERREPLARQAAGSGLSDFVHFWGRTLMGPDLNARYNAADLFALPSLSEGSPRAVLEAMGHSLPVVATPVGNIPDLLDEGRRGLLTPIHNAVALADALERVLTDSDLRRRFIREGFAFARRHNADAFARTVAERAKALAREQAGGMPST